MSSHIVDAAYLLHLRPYRDSSAIAEFLTLRHGRVSAVARGVRRPSSKMRGVLQQFVPLQLECVGRSDLKSVRSAEAVAQGTHLTGLRLVCALYLNELLQKLLSPYQSFPQLYLYYQYALNELNKGEDIEGALRTFERSMLCEMGYDPGFTSLRADAFYGYEPDQGFILISEMAVAKPHYSGEQLLLIAEDNYQDIETRRIAKRVMRRAIDHLLDGKTLVSRQLFTPITLQE